MQAPGGRSAGDWLSGAGWYGSVKVVGGIRLGRPMCLLRPIVQTSNVCVLSSSVGGSVLVVLSVLLSRPRSLDARSFASPFSRPHILPHPHSRPLVSRRVHISPHSRIRSRVPLSLVRGGASVHVLPRRSPCSLLPWGRCEPLVVLGMLRPCHTVSPFTRRSRAASRPFRFTFSCSHVYSYHIHTSTFALSSICVTRPHSATFTFSSKFQTCLSFATRARRCRDAFRMHYISQHVSPPPLRSRTTR